MKKTITLLLLFLGAHLLQGQEAIDFKKIHKQLARVNDTLYAGINEVTNAEYNAFLSHVKQNNPALYNKVFIDSSRWGNGPDFNEPFIKYYHQHPAYKNYPVVNISHEGAVQFCRWLTGQYNTTEKRKYQKVVFRLPTEAEWVLAAKGGNPDATYPWAGNSLKVEEGKYQDQFRCNYRRNAPVDTTAVHNADITAPVASYWPNGFGLYNMAGNVAEMVGKKGEIKGGSWRDTAEHMKIESKVTYKGTEEPAPYIGFRYFAIVLQE